MRRENLPKLFEIKNLALADTVLVIAFTLTFMGGIVGLMSNSAGLSAALGIKGAPAYLVFVYLLPISFVGVTLSFIFHELMHKFAAQHYGAIAGFRASYNGLLITLITGMFGFLVGIPGATMIYTNNFSKKENGIVSLAGPLTNFTVFGIFLAIELAFGNLLGPYLSMMVSFTLFISILLAFFNMLPVFPLDGSKVLAWNKPVYFGTMAVIFALMMLTSMIPLASILLMIIMAIFLSFVYKGMF